MADFDFRTRMQAPDYRLPPEVLNLLAQAVQQRNQQYAQLGQVAGQLGSGALQGYQQGQKNKQIKQYVDQQAAQMGPQPRQVTAAGMTGPVAAYDPQSNQVTPQMTSAPTQNALMFQELQGMPPDLLEKVIGPMIQSQAKSRSGGGKPMMDVWRNKQTGEIVDSPPSDAENWSKFTVSDSQALQQESNFKSQAERNKYLEGRVEQWKRSLDNRQIDTLVKTVGLTPKNISALQQSVARGQRGMDILNDPNVTWQALHAAGIDFAGIMQGGVPSVDEVKNSTFPNWHEDTAKWDTYIQGDVPTTVPANIRRQMIDMLAGSTAISGRFLEANDKFTRTMIEPTIQGGLSKKQRQSMDTIQNVTTTVTKPGSGKTDYSSMSDEQLRRIAAGGQ